MSQDATVGVIPLETLGDRLSRSLRHANVSSTEMADYLGVHRNTISSYLNDRATVKTGTLRLWSMRTGVPLEWLETGGGQSPSPTPPGGGRQNDALARLTQQKTARASSRTTRRYASTFSPEPVAA